MTTNKKIERAYIVKDIENDNLECAMISKLNMEINSIDEKDMKDFIKILAGAKHALSWARELNLREHSSITQPTFALT